MPNLIYYHWASQLRFFLVFTGRVKPKSTTTSVKVAGKVQNWQIWYTGKQIQQGAGWVVKVQKQAGRSRTGRSGRNRIRYAG